MNFNKFDCADSNTKFCPCHLADMNECILCSQLCGSKFCDCTNWCGSCIFQEYIFNNSKPRKGRDTFISPILDITFLTDKLIKIIISVEHSLTQELSNPGSFIFIKGDENENYFDFPISIAKVNSNYDTLTFYIEVKGPKTKKILNLKKDDNLLFRAPYFNGVFGLSDISSCENSKALIISRGIGIAPSYPIYKKLLSQNNDITLIHDISPFESDFFCEYPNDNILYKNIIKDGELSTEIKSVIYEETQNGTKFIHCGGGDILTYKIIEFLDSIDRSDIKLSCLNNAKMCCGEGMCGSCTTRFNGDKIKRLCKIQTDPRSIFKERRFI